MAISWIAIAVIGQIINALSILIDRRLVNSANIDKPGVYAFYVAMLSGFVVWLLPLGLVHNPTGPIILASLVNGLTYIFSILFLYKTLKDHDASDVAPVFGAVSALSTFAFNFIFLSERFPLEFVWGFAFLVVGTAVMAYYYTFSKKHFVYIVCAGVLFGLSSVFLKMLFLETTFWNGFFWSRMAGVLGGLFLLLSPANARAIISNIRKPAISAKFGVVANKALASISFLFLFYAIKIGNVSIVNALTGVQFAFLFLLTELFANKFPVYFHKPATKRLLVQKSVGTALIMVGLAILFF